MNTNANRRPGKVAVVSLTAALLFSSCVGIGTDVGNPGDFDFDEVPVADSGAGQDASAGGDSASEPDMNVADTSLSDATEPTDANSDANPSDVLDSDGSAADVTLDSDLPDSLAPDADPGDAVSGDGGLNADAEPDAGDAVGTDATDAAVDTADDTTAETDSFVVTDPYEGRPAGQCARSADCPGDFTFCADTAPGGICNGCTPDGSDCPAGTQCGEFGACQRDCTTVADCPLGLTCNSSGVCALLRCVAGVCPVPQFSCSESGLCNRATCSPDAPCPGGTTCVEDLCIEDNLLD